MIIYLEGPDGSGKTRLVKTIIWHMKNRTIDYKLGEPLIPTNPRVKGRVTKNDLIVKLYDMLTNDKVCYILDRGPISDCIYRLFDEYEPVIEMKKLLDLYIRYSDKMLFVYCNNERAEEYMNERGDDNPVSLTKHHKITQVYEMIMPLLSAHVHMLKYDFTQDYGKTIKAIESWLIDKFC